jgi:hypothetical protein
MDKTHAIIWWAPSRGSSGMGTKRFSKEEAETLAARLNEEHEDLLHRAINTEGEDPAAVLAAMKASEKTAQAQIVSYPDVVAAQAAAADFTELLPNIAEKVIRLKDVSEPPSKDVSVA